MEITGVMISYYSFCKKRLWYHLHDFNMERHSEFVKQGKIIDEETYVRETKHVSLIDNINIDFIDNNKIIKEIKKSFNMSKSGKLQVQYYLYVCNNLGLDIKYGIIVYPLLKQQEYIYPDNNFENIIKEIEQINNMNVPPKGLSKSKCKNCSFFDLCYC